MVKPGPKPKRARDVMGEIEAFRLKPDEKRNLREHARRAATVPGKLVREAVRKAGLLDKPPESL